MTSLLRSLKSYIPLVLIGIFVSLFNGAAFAADLNSFGVTPPPDSDLSIQGINQIFGLVGGNPSTNVLSSIMSIWNASMMFIGSLIVGYIIISGVLKTAHEGEALGSQWSSIFIPFKASIGLAATAPVLAGYSAIQLIVVWVAIQGVGIADMMWDKVVSQIASNGGFVTTPAPTDEAYKIVSQVYLNATCMVALQKEINSANAINPGTYPDGTAIVPIMFNSSGSGLHQQTISGIKFGNQDNSKLNIGDAVCGKFTWTKSDENNTAARTATGVNVVSLVAGAFGNDMGAQIVQSQQNAVVTAYNTLLPVVQARFGQSSGTIVGNPPTASQVQPAVDNYNNVLVNAVSTMQDFVQNQGLKTFGDSASKDGWSEAGAYYIRIGHFNEAANEILKATPSPSHSEFQNSTGSQGGLYFNVYEAMKQADIDMQNLKADLTPGATTGKDDLVGTGLGVFAHPFLAMQDSINNAIASSGDAMSRSQNIGHIMLDAGYAIYGTKLIVEQSTDASKSVEGLLTSAASWISGGFLKTAINAVVGIMNALIPILFLGGAVLAYVFPMVPYVLMLFAVMSWLTSVFIAVVAAPLWAISHATPDGHEAFGSGSNGYVLLMSVALRPSLTIIAMVGSMGIMFAMDKIFQIGWMTAYAGAQVNSVTGVIGLATGLLMYAAVSLMLVYGSFRMVQTVPDAILQWIGGRDDDSIGVEQHNDKIGAAVISMRGQAGQVMSGAGAAVNAGKENGKGKGGGNDQANKDLSPKSTGPDNFK